MKKKAKKSSRVGELEEYLKAIKKADRESELERNGGKWVAKDRPHKNKKKYDRKRYKNVNIDEIISRTINSFLNEEFRR